MAIKINDVEFFRDFNVTCQRLIQHKNLTQNSKINRRPKD